MRQIEQLKRNRDAFERAVERARNSMGGLEGVDDAADSAAEAVRGTRPLESLRSVAEERAYAGFEAIILADMRPAYFVNGDEIRIEGDYDRMDLLVGEPGAEPQPKAKLEKLITAVGRVDLFGHRSLPYAGTGWLIDESTVVTNRHVAEVFAARDVAGQPIISKGAFGQEMKVLVDTVRQNDPGTVSRPSLEVTGILYVAGPREPDIAFLTVQSNAALTPLDLFDGKAQDGLPVAAVGYPAWDGGRNDPELMKRLFKDIYDVKRFSPGFVTDRVDGDLVLLTDYTSLGGNSGSAVIDLATGHVVGLHFAGVFRDTNFAVASDVVLAARRRLTTLVQGADLPEMTEKASPEAFAGRSGYAADFLGADHAVPLPALSCWANDVAPVSDDPNSHLKYTHFTVVQSASRRLPLLTAVNIDGGRTVRLKRRGNWRLDGRLADEHQIGNELYRSNPLDRGHMVRRRDPGWGERDEAQAAEADTFHYTNCAPQHADLNQKDWLGLEDYIMEAAETRDFKVSVFTGPVFRDEDKRLKRQPGAEDVQIPEEFWKVAVIVNENTHALSATGYVLSHGRMIRGLTEAAFVYGEYKTYQVKLARIEAATGLDFGELKEADPLRAEPESVFGRAAMTIEGPQDLRL